MKRSRPDLIVPIRDRRQHRRILTLKNFRNACFVLVAMIAGMMIEGHFQRPKAEPGFGRLTSARVEPVTAIRRRPEIVPEVIPDTTAANPTAPQSPILLDGANAPQPAGAVAPRPVGSAHVAIVGGPDGVSIAQEPRPRPILGGGFGRP